MSASNDKLIKVWKLERDKSPPTDRHYMQPECITSSGTLGLVISGAPDATKVWAISNGECILTFDSPTSSLTLTLDEKFLFTGAKNGDIKMWDLTSFSIVHTFEGHTAGVTFLSEINSDSLLSASMQDSTLKLWSLKNKECLTLIGHSAGIKCVAVSRDKTLFVSGSYDCNVRVWNTKKNECVSTFTGHTKVVWCVALNSTDTEVASGGDDSIIYLWSISSATTLLRIECPDNVKCISFTPNNEAIIAGVHCSRNQLKAWNTSTGECVTDYKGHTHAVMCMLLVDDHFMVTGSRDGLIRLWKIHSGDCLADFDLQSQVKYISLAGVNEKEFTLAATTKSGPIAIVKCTL